MISTDHCKLMSDYNRWMNERLYALCETIDDVERKRDRGAFFGSIHRTLDHILCGDLMFMSRFTGVPGEPPTIGKQIHADFVPLKEARGSTDDRISQWVVSLDDDWLRHVPTYKSQVDGLERSVPRWVQVTHMFNHQTHHRGQITTLLSQLGHDMGSTDIPFMEQFLS